jgi:seryl-tRNA synthetase
MPYTETIEKKTDQIIVTLKLDQEIPRNIIPLIAYKMHFFHDKLHKFYIDVENRKNITFTYEASTDVADISKLSELTYGLITEEQDALVNRVTKRRIGEKVSISPDQKFFYDKDPAKEMEQRGWIIPFGQGQWFYMPQFTAVQTFITNLFKENFIKKLGFGEAIFPKLIPAEFYQKSLHLESMPQNLFYVCPPRKAYAIFEKVKQESRETQQVPYELIRSGLQKPVQVLSAFQCDPFYLSMAKIPITKEMLPIRLLDCSGPTYRNEGTNCEGLYRLNEFIRMELTYLGSPQEITDLQTKTRTVSEDVFNLLELDWWTEIGDDPFYLTGRMDERRTIDLPPDPKYELRISLPYKSRGGNKAGVAVGSYNNHGEHYIDAFQIKAKDGTKIWTGCTGIGITRLAMAFFAQKGFDPKKWPAIMQPIAEQVFPKIK